MVLTGDEQRGRLGLQRPLPGRPAAHRLELREHPWQRFGGDRALGEAVGQLPGAGPARFRCRPSPGDRLPVEVWVVVTGVFGLEGSAVTLGMRGPCASRRARRRRTAPSQPGNGSSTQTSPPKLAAACGCAPPGSLLFQFQIILLAWVSNARIQFRCCEFIVRCARAKVVGTGC